MPDRRTAPRAACGPVDPLFRGARIFFLLATMVLLLPAAAEPVPAALGADSAAVESTVVAAPSSEAPFELNWGPTLIPLRVMAVFALPGERVAVRVASAEPGFHAVADSAALAAAGNNAWSWRAPAKPGHVTIRVTAPTGDQMVLNAFVLVPYKHMSHGVLDGQRIGAYPSFRSRSAAYARPRGFVRVTPDIVDVEVAPHFRLGQFVCKDQADYPKFLVLQPALLVKLERLLDTAHRNGFDASTFHVMSAYRTPVYNKSIGNVTTFSRHVYGDAADIYLDEFPADGEMDDLNRDGRLTRADAGVLQAWADAIDRDPASTLTGGLSAYGSTEEHGPFVHVDTRGVPARW